ncbi:LexA family protein [Chitinophagaceae bacterium LWZ2-11]
MDAERGFEPTYKGSKKFSQADIQTANATGFTAAADDYMERGVDLNEKLIRNKPATFFFRMNSDAMLGAGIHAGDLLIVDRSIKPTNGRIIIAIIEGELMVRRIHKNLNSVVLSAENKKFADINASYFDDRNNVWGVVTYVIHSV